jgi:carboxyl-terminal processing protease
MKAFISILCSLALAASLATAADPTPLRAMDAYDHAQSLRDQARAKLKAEPSTAEGLATAEDLGAAAALLREALDYLATPQVRELGEGNLFLYARRQDVLRDYAAVLARQGKKGDALRALELMQQEAWLGPPGRYTKMREFESLKDEPRFKRLEATVEASERLWKIPAIATPFKATLSVEERIAGLGVFWSEARRGFVYFDHVPDLQWDRVYLEFIDRVMKAETTEEYYRVMMQLAPLLKDGHTNIYPPKELRTKFYSSLPIRTERIGGKVYVTEVHSASLGARIQRGDEIVAIDGVPVERYGRESVDPFVSSSTPQDRELRTYTYQLLAGDSEKAVVLVLRDPRGRERTESIARKGHTDVARPAPFQFRKIGDVAYLPLEHFESDAGAKAFEKALPDILASKSLVLDLRRNGGGSTYYGMQILSYLIPDPLPEAKQRIRGETAWFRTAGGGAVFWVPSPESTNARPPFNRNERFTGPVAVLIGPQTFSAAEDFVMMFDASKRGVLVGSTTAGSTGQPMSFPLPGGGTARICVKRDTYPDGREFVGIGIAPNVAASGTAEDLLSGRDAVLERAIAELSK